MKKTTILAAAVSGLLVGSTAVTLTSCGKEPEATAPGGAVLEKHACKGLNSCKGKGGCATGDNGCKGKNSCNEKGGCATVAHHGCAKQNECKGQGGCGATKGKNECKGQGGCAVPIKH